MNPAIRRYYGRAVRLAANILPPVVWNGIRRVAGKRPNQLHTYQGVSTPHNMVRMHSGRFATLHERFAKLDPHHDADTTRLRHYHIWLFANYAKDLPGDFLAVGISYGVAARLVYELVQFQGTGKTLHLIDPFVAAGSTEEKVPSYNTDADYVAAQYPAGASVKIHKRFIPECFPLDGVTAFAFVHLNTGVAKAEADSLAYLWTLLVRGGRHGD